MNLKKTANILGCKGSLTVQFLLGFVLILSFMSLFFMMTITLAVSEVIQYITFSSSRELFLGNRDKEEQVQKAKNKYQSLTQDKFNFNLNNNNLIKITKVSDMDLSGNNYIGLNQNFVVAAGKPNLFYGVWADFTPKILSVNTLWGSTDPGQDPNTYFKTTIGSYLGREPSQEECRNFNKERWNKIKQLHGQSQHQQGILNIQEPSSDSLQSDNGC